MAKKDFELTWKEIPVGAIVHEPGNASEYQTGDWRSQMPVLDRAQMREVRHLLPLLPRALHRQRRRGLLCG